mgnify:CR=1 FL=1
MVDSITYEEANTDAVNWVKQRSRWYKGYAQTWLVHMRNPMRTLREVGFGGFIRFNLFVGGTPLLAALNPISWMLVLSWFIVQPQFIMDIIPTAVYYAGMAGWLVGNFAFYYLNLMVAYDFRETAPAGASPGMFLKDGVYDEKRHHEGHLSVGVPGSVAGLHMAWKEHGRLPWRRLLEPAVSLAREGFVVSDELARSLAGVLPAMKAYPASLAQLLAADPRARPASARAVLAELVKG